MDDLIALVTRAQACDLDAYGCLVQRFQDMAVGYGYAILGDVHLAEDAAQEAFITAYIELPELQGLHQRPSGPPGQLDQGTDCLCASQWRPGCWAANEHLSWCST